MPTSIKRFFSLNCDSFRKQSIELEKNSCPKNCLLIMRKYKEKQQKCIFLFDNKPLLIVQTVFHTVVYLARSIYQKCLFYFSWVIGDCPKKFCLVRAHPVDHYPEWCRPFFGFNISTWLDTLSLWINAIRPA